MNKKLDILFVHPNAAIEIYQKLAKDHSAIETPIWAAMLANHVRSRGHQTAIVDCEAEQYTVAEAQNVIKDFDAKIVCFVVYGQQPSASTQNMTGAVKLANAIKQNNPEQKILFVGPHVSALPQETLEKETSIDFVCQNEGVYAIDNLLNVENLDDDSQLSNVKGICFKTKDNFVVTNLPEAIVPKNRLEIDLPGLAWDLLPSIEKYRTAGWHSWSNNSDKSPFASIYTSLGCPYRCSFCMINIINRTKLGSDVTSQDSNIYRWWNPEFIIKQFDHIALMGVKNVKIADELFVLNPAHFMKICDLIIERKYDFNIWAYSRVDTCKPEYLDKLQNAGVKWLTLGIENPNNTLRKEIHKENFQEVKITNQIKTMRDAGINVGGNYIVGLPFDTLETMNQTLDFCFENMTEMVNIYTAMAYPGSPLYRDAKSRKKKLPETYSGYSQHSYDTINLSNDKLTAAEILKFRDDAWMKYHTDVRYLSLIEKKFGIKAKENIDDVVKTKLKRKILGD